MQPIVKAALTVLLLLGLAPVVAVSALVFGDSERWREAQHPLAILAMAFFGLFTTPLWPTFLPALVLTPLAMHKVSQTRSFKQIPFPLLLGMGVIVGALAGMGVLLPIVCKEGADPSGNPVNWARAGAVSGAVSLVVIFILHRIGNNEAASERDGGY